MAKSEIHATLTPNEIVKPAEEALVLKIDSPARARDVRIQLVEMDSQIRYEKGRDDVIAIFEGKIVQVGEKGEDKKRGKFQGRLIRESEPQEGAPTFKFKFEHDNTTHELLIPSGRGEHEHGSYEIGIKITGKVAGRIRVFASRAPSYIRGLAQANERASHRSVVTFLAAKGDVYYKNASAFWYPVSDGMKYNMSLQGIINWLSKSSSRRTKDGMEFGEWGEINIVSHASESGWTSLPLLNGNNKLMVSLKSLKKYKDDMRLALSYDNSGIDKETTIVWRGCNVGKSQEFLKEARELFGGECSIYAPKYLQNYSKEWRWRRVKRKKTSVTHAWESFEEDFYFNIPWKNAKKVGKRWRKPNLPKLKACAERLMKKYPEVKYNLGGRMGQKLDEAGWLALLKRKKNRKDSKRPLRFSYTVPFFGNPRSYRKMAYAQLRMATKESEDFEHRDYAWQIKVLKLENEKSEYYLKGYRWHITCRGAAVKKKPFVLELMFKRRPKTYRRTANQRLKAEAAEGGYKYVDFLWRIGRPQKLKKREEAYEEGYRWKIVCNGYGYEQYLNIPFRGDPRDYKKMADADLRAIAMKDDRYDDYFWKIRRPMKVKRKEDLYEKGYRWKVLCEGYKYRVRVVRVLRDNDGEVVVPNLHTEGHYGHIP